MNDPVVELAERLLVARYGGSDRWSRDEDAINNALTLSYRFYEEAAEFRRKYPRRP